jgi:hypothetical protein
MSRVVPRAPAVIAAACCTFAAPSVQRPHAGTLQPSSLANVSTLAGSFPELAATYAPTPSANVDRGVETVSTPAVTANHRPLRRLQSLRRWSQPIGHG